MMTRVYCISQFVYQDMDDDISNTSKYNPISGEQIVHCTERVSSIVVTRIQTEQTDRQTVGHDRHNEVLRVPVRIARPAQQFTLPPNVNARAIIARFDQKFGHRLWSAFEVNCFFFLNCRPKTIPTHKKKWPTSIHPWMHSNIRPKLAKMARAFQIYRISGCLEADYRARGWRWSGFR